MPTVNTACDHIVPPQHLEDVSSAATSPLSLDEVGASEELAGVHRGSLSADSSAVDIARAAARCEGESISAADAAVAEGLLQPFAH